MLDNLVENGGNMAKAIRDTGLYSPVVANDPQRITESKTWQEVKEEYLPDDELGKKHKQLLNATRLEHMTFPPEGKDKEKSLTDKDIKDLLASVNCTVRKIVHGELVRHVYFWATDNRAVKDALDMAYKLSGKYASEVLSPGGSTTYNFLFNPDARLQVQAMNAVIKGLLTQPKNDKEINPNVPIVEERSEGA